MAIKKGNKSNANANSGAATPSTVAPNGVNGGGTRTGTPAPDSSTSVGTTSLPPVVGINFGNSYASIAVFTKEGLAECIANEDGERQIACAISFHGEEIYIGNQAKQQLVKNAQNTIVGFRNLLGKKFSEIPQLTSPATSAPLIQHPDLPDTPAYKVQVLQPAPAPLPTNASSYNTPQVSHAPTPRSEPTSSTRILTPHEVTGIFIKRLVQSAEAFLGKKVEGAVISVPEWFSKSQRRALEDAAKDAGGVNVLQLLDESGAVVGTTTTALWAEGAGGTVVVGEGEEGIVTAGELLPDRTQLVVDLGSSSLSLSLLSIREGLAYVLASHHTPEIGGNQVDDKLVKFFAQDFTKKTKIPLAVSPYTTSTSPSIADQRAEAKLRLAIEHTKRTISASPGAATCSVESLKEGMDYTGSINRMRFDMLAAPVYTAVSSAILSLLSSSTIDPYDIDEIVYVGGTTSLPGLDERVTVSVGVRDDIQTPFVRGAVGGGGIGDPTTVVARGCAVQAALLHSLAEEAELRAAFGERKAAEVCALTRTLGVHFPGDVPPIRGDVSPGGTWVPVVQRETALPVRRVVGLDLTLPSEGPKRIVCEVWEAVERIRLETRKKTPPPQDDDDEEEEEEEETIRHRMLDKTALLGVLDIEAKLGIQVKKGRGMANDARGGLEQGKWYTRVEVQFVVGISGDLEVEVREIGASEGAKASLKVPAP